MKTKILALLLIAAALIIAAAAPSGAASAGKANNLADGILSYLEKENGVDSVQALVDGYLSDTAGETAEWYVIALSQSGYDVDFSRYVSSLSEYISEKITIGATTRQKYALALLSAGVTSDFTEKTADETIGALGIMSKIFGLHLLNNGVTSAKYDKATLVAEIIEAQLSDGGFALTGGTGDIDVTAMALASLAPNIDLGGVSDAVDKALEMISSRQLENGGFIGFSGENAESAAQVLLALSSLGIDCESDARFVKNGNTVIDALADYRLSDGSFAHVPGGEYNFGATVQAYYSLVSYMRLGDGKTPLLVLDKADGARYIEILKSGEETPDGQKIAPYKIIATGVLIAVFIGACVILIALKKKNAKNFIAAALILAAALTFVWLTDIRSPSDYYGSDVKKENVVGEVSLTIRCDTIVGKSTAPHIPRDGVILGTSTFELAEGETVYDILVEAARKNGISIDANSVGYVSGIAYIYELDFGSLSGWMYFVNGESPNVSANRYVLSDGDMIEWLYSCDIGNDLK